MNCEQCLPKAYVNSHTNVNNANYGNLKKAIIKMYEIHSIQFGKYMVANRIWADICYYLIGESYI